jgi:hypothetical protein
MTTFKTLSRFIQEQCLTVKNPVTGRRKAVLKDPADISADSLQNPSDPDATYSAHKGKGYQAQLLETCNSGDSAGKTEEGEKKKDLNLILYVDVEGARKHDGAALIPTLESLKEKGYETDTLLADTAYGSDENYEYAAKNGINLISPVAGKKQFDEKVDNREETTPEQDGNSKSPVGRLNLSDFECDNKGQMVACPEGQEAINDTTSKEDALKSNFDVNICRSCPRKDDCPVRVGKHTASITYTQKDLRLAKRRVTWKEAKVRKAYRLRSGIEATNSQLSRQFGIKRLRVRGMKAVKMKIVLKALCLNIWRVCRFNKTKAS